MLIQVSQLKCIKNMNKMTEFRGRRNRRSHYFQIARTFHLE